MEKFQHLLQQAAFLRRPVGFVCLVIGVIGWIFPILPGWPFIIPAVALLGRRDPMIRHPHIWFRRTLRRMRRARQQWVRQLGVRGSFEYVRVRRMVTPLIDQAERALNPERVTAT